MKRKIALFAVLAVVAMAFVSCGAKEEKTKEIITKKIMYDVPVVNEDLKTPEDFERDWFYKNIPLEDMDKLLTKLYDDVKAGKIKSYKYDITGDYEEFEEIAEADLKKNFEENWFVYEYHDAPVDTADYQIITTTVGVDKQYIKELRFLEEWYFEGDEFCKRVIAVAPVFVYEVPGETKGRQIFYWVYLKDLKD